MEILTAEEIEAMGNSVMPEHRNYLFIRSIKKVADIAHSHEKEPEKYEKLIKAVKGGQQIPPIVVDNKNWLLDGNHRLYAHEEMGWEDIKVFEVIGERFAQEPLKALYEKYDSYRYS